MNPATFYSLVSVVLFCVALYALITRSNLLRRILAVNIMGSSVFMLLLAFAVRHPDQAPDPVPHAMVLTGIVVAVSATALALAITRHIHALTGQAQLPEDIL